MTVGGDTELLRRAFSDLPQYADRLDLLAKHWVLMSTWTRRLNLTSIVDLREAAWLHYRDCAEVIAFLLPGDVVDIGSGAGFPGVVIAALTDLPVTLLEPRSKRVSFLRTVKATLGLSNVTIREGRSTEAPGRVFANVVSRATFSHPQELADCLRWGRRLVAMRTSGSGDMAPMSHGYELLGRQRELAIWGEFEAQ